MSWQCPALVSWCPVGARTRCGVEIGNTKISVYRTRQLYTAIGECMKSLVMMFHGILLESTFFLVPT